MAVKIDNAVCRKDKIREWISFDPYDLWATNGGVAIRKAYYRGAIWGKMAAAVLSILDLLFPIMMRKLLRIVSRPYPILSAHGYLTEMLISSVGDDYKYAALADFKNQAIVLHDSVAWGLGFPWMSKNGWYGPDIPFVTHTPYVMDALLVLAENANCHAEAMQLFHATWGFLESLKVMAASEEYLALSYAPVDEPRIVVNANAYAAFAYALHAVHGRSEIRRVAREKALRLARWVVAQQQADGSWFYYADKEAGNFIDCFHSCFVVKNLLKVSELLPDAEPVVRDAIARGWKFIRENLYDANARLCRRFTLRSHLDPFTWDIYDQAEYLGLLIDFGLRDEARELAARVEKRFAKGVHWYCRIDRFGRRWGRDFLRWGIAPFLYQRARLDAALRKFACAA